MYILYIYISFIDYIYIYIYIYIYANFIKYNRHFMSTYFLLDPFEFPYYFYRILGELIYVLSIVVCIPSTFCPTREETNYTLCNRSFPDDGPKSGRKYSG